MMSNPQSMLRGVKPLYPQPTNADGQHGYSEGIDSTRLGGPTERLTRRTDGEERAGQSQHHHKDRHPHRPLLYVPAAGRDRAIVRDRLVRAGAAVTVAADAPDALQMLGTRRFSVVVVDLATERTALSTVRLIRVMRVSTQVQRRLGSSTPDDRRVRR